MISYGLVRTRAANRDLQDIATYTMAMWGVEQTKRYLMDLEQSIQQIRQTPFLYPALAPNSAYANIRGMMHHKNHVILYRVNETHITLLRVLHQRADWLNLLALGKP